MMKIIMLSICLLIYGFQNSTAWYENEKEVGTATLDFCKETCTPRLAIFHTAKLKLDNGYGLQWSLSDFRSMPDRRVGRQSVTSEGIGKSTQKYYTFGVSYMEELIRSGLPLPVIHQVCMTRYPRIHTCYSE